MALNIQHEQPQHWIFLHSSTNPQVLVERLQDYGMTYESLRMRLKPAKVAGYQRAFADGLSTLIKAEGQETFGLAVHLTELELSALDLSEGYPDMYKRIDVQVQDLCENGRILQGQTYVYADNSSYYMPTLSGTEIRSICTTIYLQRYLCGQPENRMIELPVVRAADGALQDTFDHYPTDAELADCIKGICGVDLYVKSERTQQDSESTLRPPRLSREITIEFVD